MRKSELESREYWWTELIREVGHMERMDEERLVKSVTKATVSEQRARGRPRNGWIGGMMKVLVIRSISVGK